MSSSFYKRQKKSGKQGFTLVELMVSVSVFSIVMLISMGAIISVLDANRKSGNLRSVMDNLNFTLEGMTRSIRFGTNFHCGSGGNLSLPADCAGGGNSFTVLDSAGNQITYAVTNSQITRTINGGTSIALTSPDVTIQNLTFWVYGSAPYSSGDLQQPRVVVVVKGTVAGRNNTSSTFTLETTVSQRKFDF